MQSLHLGLSFSPVGGVIKGAKPGIHVHSGCLWALVCLAPRILCTQGHGSAEMPLYADTGWGMCWGNL